MTDNALAVLKSLTIRPCQTLTPEIVPVLMELHKAGYVACGSEGWIATAAGCSVVEQKKAVRYQLRTP